MLRLEEVRFGYDRGRAFLGPISLTLGLGQCWAIVGPNGAGKSTLLRLMAGLIQPTSGQVLLFDHPLESYSHRDRARHISYVPQTTPDDLEIRAGDVVLMGRFPHRYLGLFDSPEDEAIAHQAMRMTSVEHLADRFLTTLSGGERQRVHLAAAIAQSAPIMLFDEPTSSLDLQHQLAVFRILRERAERESRAVAFVAHDVNLGAMFCDQALLLNGGRVAAMGPPREVLTPSNLEEVYGVKLEIVEIAGCRGGRWMVPKLER